MGQVRQDATAGDGENDHQHADHYRTAKNGRCSKREVETVEAINAPEMISISEWLYSLLDPVDLQLFISLHV